MLGHERNASMLPENDVWNRLWKDKSRSQSTSLDDFETFEDRITSISKNNRFLMGERTNCGLDHSDEMMRTGDVLFL